MRTNVLPHDRSTKKSDQNVTLSSATWSGLELEQGK